MARYIPAPVPTGDLQRFLLEELNKIAQAMETPDPALALDTLYAPPNKFRDGTIVKADGTTWNPGSGAGAYCFYNSVWNFLGGGGGGGSTVLVQDEGTPLATAATTLNFVGAGVVASGAGATKAITISGGGSGIDVQDEGTPLATVATTINFVGGGVTATGAGSTKTITIPAGYALLAVANTFTASQSTTSVALTSGATVNTDLALSNAFTLTLAHNATLANPTNLRDGMSMMFRIKQDGTGSRTLAYGSKFKFPGGTAPVLTTTAGAVDVLSCIYFSGDDRLECNMLKAFA